MKDTAREDYPFKSFQKDSHSKTSGIILFFLKMTPKVTVEQEKVVLSGAILVQLNATLESTVPQSRFSRVCMCA
jgi:hypothetical protein